MDTNFVILMRQLGMPYAKIAKHLGVSRNTLYKFRKRFALGEPNISVSDAELLDLIEELSSQHPTWGSVTLRGCLLARGIHVSENRVRAALRIVDPEGVAARRGRRLCRRQYSVPGANYLWHIDGNHKLGMYHFILHGCVDGDSRRIMYLQCRTNNLAKTVLESFETAVEENGTPHRVRGDHGVENVLVADYMENHYQDDSRFLYGPSVYNTRIERLWRDVNEIVTRSYKTEFISFENDGLLDVENYLDIFCLYYVYYLRIQSDLNAFTDAMNNHGLRTERRLLPNQMWALSMRQQYGQVSLNRTCSRDNLTIEHFIKTLFEHRFLKNVPLDVLESWIEMSTEVVPNPLTEDGSLGRNTYVYLRHYLSNAPEV